MTGSLGRLKVAQLVAAFMVVGLLACNVVPLGKVSEQAGVVTGDSLEPEIPGATVQFYEIEGSTRQELRSAMDNARMTDISGGRFDATTEWYISVEGPTADPNIDYINVTLPRWQPPDEAEDHLIEAWQEYVTRLAQHEANHVRFVYEAFPDIEQALRNGPRHSAQTRFEAALAVLIRRNREYDADTRHGETEGAVWESVDGR